MVYGAPPPLVDSSWIDEVVFARSRTVAAGVEDFLREAARDKLPRRLRRLADHPRLLAIAYRVRPRWRPTIFYGVDGDVMVGLVRLRDGSMLALPS